MSNLFDNMFTKRFCLPINTDIDLYERGIMNISTSICSDYNHVACVLQGKQCFEKG